MILRYFLGLFNQNIQGYGAGAEKASKQIFAGVDGDPDDPGFFVLRAVKGRSAEDIFQKYSLKYVLRISSVFQMDHTDPAYHVRILLNGSAGFFLTLHTLSPFPSVSALRRIFSHG